MIHCDDPPPLLEYGDDSAISTNSVRFKSGAESRPFYNKGYKGIISLLKFSKNVIIHRDCSSVGGGGGDSAFEYPRVFAS